jgi:eukaryotic-like serine/threonine-protein kinase
MDLYQFHWSPDGQWITFFASIQGKTKTIVYVAPFTGDRGPDERAWIQITSDSTLDSRPRWSPDGNWLYTLSDRDGYTCIWATPLDRRTKRPTGQPVAVFHSHGVRRSLRNANWVTQELSVARDKIIFGLGEITGNIWMTELAK